MNSLRPSTLPGTAVLRSVALVVAAIALAACSNVHPGSAAVVDGESISMGKVDKASAAYCKLAVAVASQQGGEAVSTSDTRRQSVADLVAFTVAKKLTKERDLQVNPKIYAITDEQKTQIANAFPGADLKQISDAIERSQHTYAVTVALGEEATGKSVSEETAEEIETVGRAELIKAYKSRDISIDPRFGLDDLTKQVAVSGSLSIPEVADAKVDPAKLPVSQRCS